MEPKKSKSGGKAAVVTTSRRDTNLFDKFADLDYLEAKFGEYMSRYKLPKMEKFLIRKALDFAKLAHNGQQRDEGVPYITHPIRVANILMDEVAVIKGDMICAALLHDVIEDCDITLRELKNNFNDRIAQMVKTLSKDPSLENHKKVYYETIVKADDEVKLIKVCDRLDNLRSLRFSYNKTRIRRYIRETEKKYLPLAETKNPYIFREMKHEVVILKSRLK
ncbi:bifunctional (p)ppGpp synthetase/guanosine-3',5'-bis(diphosphate) 3'-pyrophosphohydrolase [bacterium]|nr:bifunctional (p)ppGpp synthetase/guanosine-3',5'-bis(diphosphate) 3'-pyrophosphohydrolase [bacterium]